MANALKSINSMNINGTPQSKQAHPLQSKNRAGGYVFKTEDVDRLKRFLVLGTEGGTMYASETELSQENAQCVFRLAETNHDLLVDTIVDVSLRGAAYRQDATLFSLAVAASVGTDDEKRNALSRLPEVARTGTMLFKFTEYVQQFRGWGRALRRGVANWYLSPEVDKLAYQAVKYRQRDGWTHRDLLRLSHPVSDEPSRRDLFKWITSGDVGENVPPLVNTFKELQSATDVSEVVSVMERDPNVSWEMIPDSFLKEPQVWEQMINKGMPMTALIRQLPRFTNLGIITGATKKKILSQLGDEEYLRKSRIHPMQVLVALRTYESGRSMRGSSYWTPDSDIVEALDKAFYKTFTNVKPTGKRLLVALDVSGSMCCQVGFTGLTAIEASIAMAMIYAKTEENVDFVVFTSKTSKNGSYWGRGDDEIRLVNEFRNVNTLGEALELSNGFPFGGTDCALPFEYAYTNRKMYDAVIVLTDNETWAGYQHPYQAAERYRQRYGLDTKFVVIGMTASDSNIVNPEDTNGLAVVGFDPGVVDAIGQFIRGDV